MVRNPNGADYGRSLEVDTGRGLLKVMDPATLANFLYSKNARDVFFKEIVFGDTTMNNDPWTKSVGGGAGSPTTFAEDLTIPGGAILGFTGTTAENAVSLFGGPVLQPQLNCGFEASFKLDVITSLRFEAGLVNVVTTKTNPVCTDVDGTPTFAANSTEVAIVSWQTDDTIATPRFVGDSATYTTAKGETLMTPPGVPAADQAAWVPTADEWFTIRIQCYGKSATNSTSVDSVACMVFDDTNNLVALSTFDAIEGDGTGGITGTAMLAPWIFIAPINTTGKNLHVRYARWWADRYIN